MKSLYIFSNKTSLLIFIQIGDNELLSEIPSNIQVQIEDFTNSLQSELPE